jgi:hypothetical protein
LVEGQQQELIVSLLGELHLLEVFEVQSRWRWVVAVACLTVTNESENVVKSRLALLFLLFDEM